MAEIGVYNPDDERLEFKFDGQSYVLEPETVTMIPRAALGVMLSQVGEYGACPVPAETSREELDGLVGEARKKWLVGTRKWAEDVVLASAKANKERREVGIEPIEGPDVVQARGWLQKHGFLKAVFFLAFFLPALASAQELQKTAFVSIGKDLTDTSYSYCKLVGLNGDPFGTPLVGTGTIKTSGSNATVVEGTSGDNPFTPVAVGDVLLIQVGSTVYRRNVIARASAASITVDSVITLAGNAWSWRQQKCGATQADGWISVSQSTTIAFVVDWVTKNATSLDRSVECRLGGLTGTIVEQTSQSAAGSTAAIITDGVWDECRLGLKLTTDTGVQSISAIVGTKAYQR